jgi:hypothetical protein
LVFAACIPNRVADYGLLRDTGHSLSEIDEVEPIPYKISWLVCDDFLRTDKNIYTRMRYAK